MNCVETHDLLIDLAYGELPPTRAAEVEAHILRCASCTADKAKLDDAHRAASVMRELEEPSEGFDEPILQAARAEARLRAEGTPGPVVEVSATVSPLGLQPARLDPHARMSGAKARPRPRWWRRAAAVTSIAAAAGLAVVVTSSVTRHDAMRRAEDVAPIQVRAPEAQVPAMLDETFARKTASVPQDGAPPPKSAPVALAPEPARNVASSPAPEKAKEQADRRDQKPEAVAKKKADRLFETRRSPKQVAKHGASEGVVAFSSAERPPPPGELEVGLPGEPSSEETKRDVETKSAQAVPEAPPPAAQVGSAAPPPAAQAVSEAPPPGAQAVSEAPPPAAKVVPEAQAPAERGVSASAAPAAQAVSAAPAPAPRALSEARPQTVPLAGGPMPAAAPSPDQLEDQAGAARRSGDYARAAALYRDASALRKQSDPARAAWDLAHAVECLAAGGQVDDAIAAHTELLRAFPDQSGPKAAADSALRSVPLPADENPTPVKQ